MLNVADSRFQEALLAQARSAGKIAAGYRIPDAFRSNTPAHLEEALAAHRSAGFFSEYPFGTDLTAEEILLSRALKQLQTRLLGLAGKLGVIAAALLRGKPAATHVSLLQRLKLDRPTGARERLLRRLVVVALRDAGS
jgi:hypothetical protein